ncbi:MAG: hypothetical protein IKC09_07565 [Oscillospiraceae bacterium]|nr:hypothetical protein [Oscillospiraceae bacterium]
MDKETILQMSRAENQGKQDEREQSIEEKAYGFGRTVGLFACVLLVLISEYVLGNRDIGRGAWIIFFTMEGCSNLYLYSQHKKPSKLTWGILQLFCAVTYLVILFILNAR